MEMIYQVISAYFQDDCADELIEFKETVSNLCSIEHFYMPMNNSWLIFVKNMDFVQIVYSKNG